ncbi:MAG TPA: CobD/CbiB family protein [Burkholderiales bacterium]|nr:CobD/CbiB family protein [Burkholderiales bacterium]
MGVIAIVAALVLEQWRPLGNRKAVAAALLAWSDWLERSFNAGESHHGRIAWLIAALVPVAAAAALWALLLWMSPVAALLLNIGALYLTLGFRQFSHSFTGIQAAMRDGDVDRARELIGAWRGQSAAHLSREEVIRLSIEEGIVASHRHVFAVLFWFMLLPGPSGAILYRMAAFLSRRWGGKGEFGRFARRVLFALEWPTARLTAVAFAVVGDFEDAVYCWRTQAGAWPEANMGVVLAAAAGALGVKLGMPLAESDGLHVRPELGLGEAADLPLLDSTVGLLWRALVVWVFLLFVLALARVF